MNRPSTLLFALFIAAVGCDTSLDDTCRDGECTSTVAATSGGTGGGCIDAPSGLPCDVQAVVSTNCSGPCHHDPTANGAPFPLLTYADTQALYGDHPRWWHMRRAIQKDAILPQMPQGNWPMADADIATLNAWFDTCDPDGFGGGTPIGKCAGDPGTGGGGGAGGAGGSGTGGGTTATTGAGASGGGGAGGGGGSGGN